MMDEDVITRLVELHDHIKAPDTPPGEDAIRGERMLRRRRALVGSAAAAVVAVLGITAVATGGHRATDIPAPIQPGPTQSPSPNRTDAPTTAGRARLEQIRAEGTMEQQNITDSGITVRTYAVCDGPESVCGPGVDGPIRRSHSHYALEVSQDGRSALFGIDGEWPYVVTPYHDDAVIVLDGDPADGVDPTDPSYVRHRLLRADGSATPLRLDPQPAAAVPGPNVVVIDRAQREGESKAAMQYAFLVDESAGTLRRLDVPGNDLALVGNSWGPNTDQALWFVQAIDCRVDRITGGTVASYQPCGNDFPGRWYSSLASVDATWIPDGWLTADRMVVLEKTSGRLTLHVSLDQGATWSHIPVSDEAAIPVTLQQLV